MESQIKSMICMDLESLTNKIVKLLPSSKETILASGLLAAAAHILQGEYPPEPPREDQEPALPVSADNPGQLDIAAVAQAVAARLGGQSHPQNNRSLVDQWAGPLPSLKSKSRPIPAVKPDAACPQCGESVPSHPRDKNIGSDNQGREVFILCNRSRVRCVPVVEE